VATVDDEISTLEEFNHLKGCAACFVQWSDFIRVLEDSSEGTVVDPKPNRMDRHPGCRLRSRRLKEGLAASSPASPPIGLRKKSGSRQKDLFRLDFSGPLQKVFS